MEVVHSIVFQYLIRPLDFARASLLSYTLRIGALRQVFASRLLRSILLILASFVLNIVLMFYFPLWTLLLIPGFLGMAHLIGSLSTFHQTAAPVSMRDNFIVRRKVNSVLFITCIIFGSVRLLSSNHPVTFLLPLSNFTRNYFRLLDLTIVLGSFFYFLRLYKIPIQNRTISILGITGFSVLMFVWPALFWGIFIFSHNFMAFRYWYLHAPSRDERRVCLFSLLVFTLLHFFVLNGSFNLIFHKIPVNQTMTQLFGYTFFQVSWDLFPGKFDLSFSRKVVTLLCFGQGIHYLLWIKIIPECRLNLKRPTPFRFSFQKMQEEWGLQKTAAFVLLLPLFMMATLLIRSDLVNELFFAFAFYHIYAEYLALAIRGWQPREVFN